MKKLFLTTVTAGAFVLLSAFGARAQTASTNDSLFGITFFTNQLITIDTTTGEGHLVGNIGANVSGYGLAAYQNKLYTFNPNDQTIDQLNVTNGTIVSSKATGTMNLQGEGDLAIRSDTGIGFIASAFDEAGNPTHPLYTFDVTTGTAAFVANTAVTLDGLAFDSNNTLYAIGQGDVNGGDPAAGDATLYTVNQATGALTTIGMLGVPQNSPVAGLSFASDGTLYAAIDDQLYTVNKANGVATIVDADTPDFSYHSVSGLAFAPGMTALANISSRASVGTGENVVINGFILRSDSGVPAGTTTRLILRALGPSLADSNVQGTLDDPTLTLYDSAGMQIDFNDNYGSNSASDRQAIQQAGLTPTDSRESVIVADLPMGRYTVIVRGADGTTGVALAENYQIQPGTGINAINMSSRAFVQTGDSVLIAGLIVVGSGGEDTVIRGLGPSLSNFVNNPLADPFLELRDANGNLIQSNDDWMDSPQASKIEMDMLAPTNPKESAIDLPLSPGQYTAILKGTNNTSGVGQVEVYR